MTVMSILIMLNHFLNIETEREVIYAFHAVIATPLSQTSIWRISGLNAEIET